MILYRYHVPGSAPPAIGVGTPDGLVDLAGRDGFREVQSWAALLALPELAARLGRAFAGGAPPRVVVAWDELAPGPDPQRPHLLAPVDEQEVWGAGVTYQISRLERMKESETAASVYDQVYTAPRPELFFKAAPRRVRGPGAPIRVRADSRWTVPEPELALILAPDLRIVGYSLGNDVSARDIEGVNPLYLPQAKIYEGACALGPGMVLADGFDPLAQTLAGRIVRGGQDLWADRTEVSRLKRPLTELVEYLGREQQFPDGAVLFTGTCLVPPEPLSLQVGDVVELTLSGLGTLRNPVGP
ncbi:MAG: fumarylacetoacetate hydrolase family protein [Fimbriimonadaceae bacterium]|nr:fumarylacetoacetate hydrolase family protein [Fimbriimonadaceae bacterium]